MRFVFVFAAAFLAAAAQADQLEPAVEDAQIPAPVDADTRLRIEHSTGGVFTLRGHVQLKAGKSGLPAIEQDASPEFVAALHDLAEAKGWYMVRVETRAGSGRFAQSFVDACDFYSSNLQDTLVLTLDASGDVISLEISTASKCKPITKQKKLSRFKTSVVIRAAKIGAAVHTEDFIETVKRKQSEPAEEKSFLGKYWMYLLPIYLVFMFNKAPDAPPAARPGAAGAAGARAVGAT